MTQYDVTCHVVVKRTSTEGLLITDPSTSWQLSNVPRRRTHFFIYTCRIANRHHYVTHRTPKPFYFAAFILFVFFLPDVQFNIHSDISPYFANFYTEVKKVRNSASTFDPSH